MLRKLLWSAVKMEHSKLINEEKQSRKVFDANICDAIVREDDSGIL